MLRNIPAVLTVMFMLLHCCPSVAAGTGRQLIKGIAFKALSPNEEQVVFRLNSPNSPKFFTMKGENPRAVFDFKNTGVAKGIKNTVNTHGKWIKRIRVGIHETKTRIVFDLPTEKKVKFLRDFNKDQNTLTVIVHDAAVRPQKKTVKKKKAAAKVLPKEKKKPAQVKKVTVKQLAAQKKEKKKKTPEKEKTAVAADPKQKRSLKKAAPAAVAKKLAEDTEEKKEKPEKKVIDKAATVLSSVNFEHSNRGEMIQFRLNRFHPPVVYGLEEKKPKVICEFQETSTAARLPKKIGTDGKFVRAIRIERNKSEKKVKVVMELAPNHNYDLQQVFFKNDNLFVIIINTLN